MFKCSGTHGPGQCPRLLNKNLPICCINCEAPGGKHTNHTANDLVNCEFFKSNSSTPTNAEKKMSNRQSKKLLRQYRQSGESNRANANVTNGAGGLNINDKKKLFELFINFLDNLKTELLNL